MNRHRRFLPTIGAVFLFACSITTARAADAGQIPARAEMGSLTAELSDVSPISDHFPTAPGQPPGPHNYLLANLKLTNHGNQPVDVKIEESSISFPEKPPVGTKKSSLSSDKVGQGVPGMAVSIMDKSGTATGGTSVTVPPGEHIFQLRGDNVSYGYGALYLTLKLSSRQGAVTVRNSGSVGHVD